MMIAAAVKEHYWNENYWILTFIGDQTFLRKLKAKHKSFPDPNKSNFAVYDNLAETIMKMQALFENSYVMSDRLSQPFVPLKQVQ